MRDPVNMGERGKKNRVLSSLHPTPHKVSSPKTNAKDLKIQ